MPITRPPGMPSNLDGCWGKKFQDGDLECRQCRFNDSCRPKMLELVGSIPTATTTRPTSLPIFGSTRTPTGMVPMPPTAPPSPPVAHVRYSPSVAAPPPPQPTYSQYSPQPQQQGFALPDHHNPNPMAPMYRPGAPGPAYYFNQYPEESVAGRLTKNVLLRGLEAIFGELMYFFRHWTWPSG